MVEPWFTPDTWNPDGQAHLLTGEMPEGKICRMNISGQDGDLSILEFHYLVGTASGVEQFAERNEPGLFSVDDMKSAFTAADLAVDYPDYIRPAAISVTNGNDDLGIVLGGSGNEETMAANKVHGIRWALYWNEQSARLAKEHNNAKLL